MSKEHEIEVLARRARSEVEGDAARIVSGLWGRRPPDMRHLSDEDYRAFVGRHWQDPAYRQSLLVQVGPRNFLEVYANVFGIPKETVFSNWLPVGDDQPTAATSEAGLPAPVAADPNQGMV